MVEKQKENITKKKSELLEKAMDDCTPEQLYSMADLVFNEANRRLKIRDIEESSEYKVGDQVKFIGNRGMIIMGRVRKVNDRTLTVVTASNQRWRVPYKLVEKMPESLTGSGG